MRRWKSHSPPRTLNSPEDKKDAMWTDSDILLVYAPGSTPDNWPRGTAKIYSAGSDLVFQSTTPPT